MGKSIIYFFTAVYSMDKNTSHCYGINHERCTCGIYCYSNVPEPKQLNHIRRLCYYHKEHLSKVMFTSDGD